jgi:cytochrome c
MKGDPMKWLQLRRLALIGLVTSLHVLPGTARANSTLALDKGCYACHGVDRRGDAPALEKLSARLGRLKGDAAAETSFVEKYRRGKRFEHIDAHERISQASAALLIHWLVEGAK